MSRRTAIQKAREYLAVNPVFLDTETTGLDPGAEIIEICVINHDGTILVDTLIKPVRPIPPDAIRVHGISNEMVQTAPAWPDAWVEVSRVLAGRYIGIYNAEFDLRLMRQTHLRCGMEWNFATTRIFDVMKLYADYSGYHRWQSLEAASRQCGLAMPNSHRARADTQLLRALLMHIASRIP